MKKYKLGYFIIILITLTLYTPEKLQATRFWGSDLSWQCVGQDSFVIQLTLYRDCVGLPAHAATLNIKCKSTGIQITSKTIQAPSGVDITPVCDSGCSRCQSPSCTFPYGIEKYVYNSGIINLSGAGSCCEIEISTSGVGARPASITTGPAYQQFYTYGLLNRCLTPCDNSPTFTNSPATIICVGQDFVFNPGAADPDSDSLVYSWTPPLVSQSSSFSFNSPYTYDLPIWFWGFPYHNLPFPRGYHLDQNNGDIMFRPMKIETTIASVEVKEYRNNTHIGTVRREMGFIVINCPNNHPPVVSSPYYKEVCVDDTVTFDITTNDYDSLDTLIITINQNLPGNPIWTDSNGLSQHPSGRLVWIPDSSMSSSIPYTFTVTVIDDGCPINGRTTKTYLILVKHLPKADIITVDSNCANYWFIPFNIQGSSPTYIWYCGDSIEGFSDSSQSINHQFNNPGTYPFTFTINSQLCHKTYYDTVEIDTFLKINLPEDTFLCYGSYITISSSILYNKGAIVIQWNTGSSSASQIAVGPLFSDTLIIVTATDSIGCTSSDSIYIDIHDKINLGPDKRICSYDNTAIYAQNSYLYNVSFEWYLSGDTLPFSYDDSLILQDTGTYICEVIDSLGCTSMDSINILNPLLEAWVSDESICYGDTVILIANQTGSLGTSYYWYDSLNLLDSGQVFISNPSYSTIIDLIVKDSFGGFYCYDTHYVSINVISLPQISINPIPPVCINYDSFSLNSYANPSGGNWTSKAHGIVLNDHFFPAFAGKGSHTVYYTYSDSNTSCTNKDSGIVTVNSLPLPIAGYDDTLCTDEGYYFFSGTPNSPPGIWSGSGVKRILNDWCFDPNDSLIQFSKSYPMIYFYTDTNGCENSDTLYLIVFKKPSKPIAGIIEDRCLNDSTIVLQGNPTGGSWYGQGVNNNMFDPVTGTGTYQLVYKVDNNGYCYNSDTTSIIVNPLPSIDFYADSLSGIIPFEVNFDNASLISSGNIDSFLWDFGDSSISNVKNPKHVYLKEGTYTIKLKGISDMYCENELIKPDYISVYKVGINESFESESFKIIPNPVSDKTLLILKNQNLSIVSARLINSIGEVVREYPGINKKEFVINRADLNNGIYIIDIKLNTNTRVFQRIVFY